MRILFYTSFVIVGSCFLGCKSRSSSGIRETSDSLETCDPQAPASPPGSSWDEMLSRKFGVDIQIQVAANYSDQQRLSAVECSAITKLQAFLQDPRFKESGVGQITVRPPDEKGQYGDRAVFYFYDRPSFKRDGELSFSPNVSIDDHYALLRPWKDVLKRARSFEKSFATNLNVSDVGVSSIGIQTIGEPPGSRDPVAILKTLDLQLTKLIGLKDSFSQLLKRYPNYKTIFVNLNASTYTRVPAISFLRGNILGFQVGNDVDKFAEYFNQRLSFLNAVSDIKTNFISKSLAGGLSLYGDLDLNDLAALTNKLDEIGPLLQTSSHPVANLSIMKSGKAFADYNNGIVLGIALDSSYDDIEALLNAANAAVTRLQFSPERKR